MINPKNIYLNNAQLNAELSKCLDCKTKPCMTACPVSCSPQEFIRHAKNNNFDEAVKSICKNNPFAHSCGLVCPDNFCMKACLRSKIDHPINIPLIQATIINKYRKIDIKHSTNKNGKTIAIVGAGPAGLAAAYFLLNQGYKIKIFEKNNKIGGALNLIPDNRLPFEAILDDWNYIKSFGDADIEFDCLIDNPKDLIEQGFDGVVMAVGEQIVLNLGVDGEHNIVSYDQFLHSPEKYATSGKVAIIGGGNVAADCAITAKKQGADIVSLFIRRKIFDMKVCKKEMESLLNHQIDLVTTTRVCKVELSDNKFDIYTCSTELINGRYEDIKNSVIKRKGFDLVIKAIGSKAEKHVEHKKIVYAGDCKIGGSTIVEAVASGLDSAKLIHNILTGETK